MKGNKKMKPYVIDETLKHSLTPKKINQIKQYLPDLFDKKEKTQKIETLLIDWSSNFFYNEKNELLVRQARCQVSSYLSILEILAKEDNINKIVLCLHYMNYDKLDKLTNLILNGHSTIFHKFCKLKSLCESYLQEDSKSPALQETILKEVEEQNCFFSSNNLKESLKKYNNRFFPILLLIYDLG